VAQAVGPCGPESSDGLADSVVLWVGLLVDEAGVCELALCGGGGAVDLAVRERLELGKLQAVGEGVDARVHEEAEAFVVGGGLARVLFEGRVTGWGRLLGEVLARVEVLDYGAHGVDVAVREDNPAGLAYVGVILEVVWFTNRLTPPGANCSTCFANSGDLTRTASWAEYVVRASPLPTTTSTMGLFIKLGAVSFSSHLVVVALCSGICAARLTLLRPREIMRLESGASLQTQLSRKKQLRILQSTP